MKSSIVRARIDHDLKAQAGAVLAACGLDMSEALRLFLVQVVAAGGLPFAVRQPVRRASVKTLKKMKRDAQARDRRLVAQGGADDSMFLIHPDLVKKAQILWPDVDM